LTAARLAGSTESRTCSSARQAGQPGA
jgi:hypothetical protein